MPKLCHRQALKIHTLAEHEQQEFISVVLSKETEKYCKSSTELKYKNVCFHNTAYLKLFFLKTVILLFSAKAGYRHLLF